MLCRIIITQSITLFVCFCFLIGDDDENEFSFWNFFFFSSSMKTFGCCLWNKTKRIYNRDWKFWTQNWFNQKDIKGCFFVSVVNLNSARNNYKLPIYIYTNYIDFGNQYIKSNIGNIKKKQMISRNYKDYQWCNL